MDTWLYIASLGIMMAATAAIFAAIFRKAGFSGGLGLLMLVPVVNLFILVWFAATTWPLEMRLQEAAERQHPRRLSLGAENDSTEDPDA